jgi:hypothetical protein
LLRLRVSFIEKHLFNFPKFFLFLRRGLLQELRLQLLEALWHCSGTFRDEVLESEFSVLEQVISFPDQSKLIGGWIAHDEVVFLKVLVFLFGEVETSLDAEEASFAI